MERRRGEALEEAIKAAAWQELSEVGYPGFTLGAVASRAETSRPVLGRRWTSKADLAVAAISYYLHQHPVDVPNAGNLRDDLIILLLQTSRRSCAVNGVLFSMRDYFAETGFSLADVRGRLAPNPSGIDAMEIILQRGIERGEIDAGKLTKRIASVPMDLIRHETLMTNSPASKRVVTEIVDTVFLPLARSSNPAFKRNSR